MSPDNLAHIIIKRGEVPVMKFVQIYDLSGLPHFRAEGGTLEEYQNLQASDVLERLLNDVGIPVRKIDGPYGREIVDPNGDFLFAGGGELVELGENHFGYRGRILTYDKIPNPQHFEDLLAYLPPGTKFEPGENLNDR